MMAMIKADGDKNEAEGGSHGDEGGAHTQKLAGAAKGNAVAVDQDGSDIEEGEEAIPEKSTNSNKLPVDVRIDIVLSPDFYEFSYSDLLYSKQKSGLDVITADTFRSKEEDDMIVANDPFADPNDPFASKNLDNNEFSHIISRISKGNSGSASEKSQLKSKKKRVVGNEDEYDVDDPWIDDEEAHDERLEEGALKTKYGGFFIAEGEIALDESMFVSETSKTPKKKRKRAKSKKKVDSPKKSSKTPEKKASSSKSPKKKSAVPQDKKKASTSSPAAKEIKSPKKKTISLVSPEKSTSSKVEKSAVAAKKSVSNENGESKQSKTPSSTPVRKTVKVVEASIDSQKDIDDFATAGPSGSGAGSPAVSKPAKPEKPPVVKKLEPWESLSVPSYLQTEVKLLYDLVKETLADPSLARKRGRYDGPTLRIALICEELNMLEDQIEEVYKLLSKVMMSKKSSVKDRFTRLLMEHKLKGLPSEISEKLDEAIPIIKEVLSDPEILSIGNNPDVQEHEYEAAWSRGIRKALIPLAKLVKSKIAIENELQIRKGHQALPEVRVFRNWFAENILAPLFPEKWIDEKLFVQQATKMPRKKRKLKEVEFSPSESSAVAVSETASESVAEKKRHPSKTTSNNLKKAKKSNSKNNVRPTTPSEPVVIEDDTSMPPPPSIPSTGGIIENTHQHLDHFAKVLKKARHNL
eukprot:Nk52_evm71s2192 gene=Nk52_evmTU71s2192